FYDVSNAVRRALHRGFIRQNLNNFTNEPNVIQFTSAEFTGPLSFEEFWLDTIAEWESETKFHPLVALAAPKDVQDAILADGPRAAVVDVICFRYWWQTSKGLFAPAGGQNLAPRQFERQWKGGSPRDENLAGMAAEYRRKFPAKAIIASGEDVDMSTAGWAYVCAGGSLPHLPRTMDATLRAAIPRMQPWFADDSHKVWAIAEPGWQYLAYTAAGTELDLSADTGTFRVTEINAETGGLKFAGQIVKAGGKAKLPAGIFWLTKE
ncbi:MAG TPA: DUF6298 domain-containing protein, partial [Verrucomicrobiae bacterium]